MFGRKKVAMLVAEFLGTAVLTMVVLAVQRSTLGIPYFVALAAGLAVAALTYVLGNASGAHLNPAITVGAALTRRVKALPALAYLVAQFLGGWAAYLLYTYFVNSSFPAIGGHFTLRLLVAEAVGALVFAFLWAGVAAQRLPAALSGVAFAIGILVASIASVGIINPAVAVGTRAFAFWGSMGWGTYLAGPLIGGVVGFLLADLLFGTWPWTLVRVAAPVRPAVVAAPTRRVAAKPARKPASRRR